MEVFVAAREKDEVLELMGRLNQLGLRGRDAAYLASVQLPCSSDPSAQQSFLEELKFMVGPDRMDAAARLIGLES